MKTEKMFGKTTVLILALLVLAGSFTDCRGAGEKRKAVKAFKQAETFYKQNAFAEAIAEYTKAIELDPQYAKAFIGRANALGWGVDANLDLVQVDLEAAAAIDPRYQDYADGYELFREDTLESAEKAIETFNTVIKNKINLMDAYSYRANLYYGIGDIEQAITDHSKAILQNKNFYGNYFNRAYCYFQLKQYDEAISDFDKAIQLYPQHGTAHHLRGMAYYMKQDYAPALADFSQAIELNPSELYQLAELLNIRALTHSNLGNYDEAIDDFSQIIALYPDEYTFYINRGWAYLSKGDIDEAFADVNTALMIEPSSEGAKELMTKILLQKMLQEAE